MSEKQGSRLASGGIGLEGQGAWRSAEQILDELLSKAEVPRLREMLSGDDAEAIRAELLALVQVLVPNRAPRQSVKVVAKILRNLAGQEVEDPVVVRDISQSGAQLAISIRLGVGASDLTRIRLRVRVSEKVDRVVDAVLARVVRVDPQFIIAGFRFENVDAELATQLGNLRHVQSVRARAIYTERMSQGPTTMKGEPEPAERPRGVLGPKLG